jgi:hypothetical protein
MLLARASLRFQELPSKILDLPFGERAFMFASVELERRSDKEVLDKGNIP